MPTPIADAPPDVVNRMRDVLRTLSSDFARFARSSGNPMLQGASSSPDNLDSLDPYGFVDINGEPYLTRNQILSPEAGGASRGERHQEDMGRINVDFDGTGNDLYL